MIADQPLTLVIDGQTYPLGLDSDDPLVRSVMISLFTWRRANADDELPGDLRMGWWGDSYAEQTHDRIGSRLWLLSRAKFSVRNSPVPRAKEYAEEALKWLVDDGVVARVEVEAERHSIDTLALACRFYRSDGRIRRNIRFANVWEYLK